MVAFMAPLASADASRIPRPPTHGECTIDDKVCVKGSFSWWAEPGTVECDAGDDTWCVSFAAEAEGFAWLQGVEVYGINGHITLTCRSFEFTDGGAGYCPAASNPPPVPHDIGVFFCHQLTITATGLGVYAGSASITLEAGNGCI